MKKVFKVVLWGIIVSSLCGILSGCDYPPPRHWDVSHQDSSWEVWGQGEIFKVEIVPGQGCNHDTPQEGCRKAVKYTFSDGTSVSTGYVKDPGTIKIGGCGIFYKYNVGNPPDKIAYFQWIPDKTVANRVKPQVQEVVSSDILEDIVEKPAEIKIDYENLSPKYYWKKKNAESPKFNETVLVRLESGVITTAYMLPNGDWKYSLYKDKTGGGLTATEIVEWKNVDLN